MPFTVGNLNIDRISGPVSMTILVPKEPEFNTMLKQGIRLPIQVLFGDVHNSSAYMCDNCSCKSSGNCCVKVYGKDFLQSLDSLASAEFPVDIYIETFRPYDFNSKGFYLKQAEVHDVPPLDVFNDYRTCYNRELRGSVEYEKNCPTREIKWHYVDPRHEIELAGKKFDFIEPKIHFMFRENKLGIMFVPNTRPSTFLRDLKMFYKSQFNDVQEFLFALDVNKMLLQSYIEPWTYIEKLVMTFFVPMKYKSLINKQVKKYKDISKMKPYVSSYIKYVVNQSDIYNYENVLKAFDLIEKNISVLLKGGKPAEKIASEILKLASSSHNFLAAFRGIKTIILDIYAILRMFKPIDSNPAWLNISYYGDTHSRNLAHFYTKIFPLYNSTKVEQPFDYTTRCMKMPNINLMDIGKQFGVKFSTTIAPIAPAAPKPKLKLAKEAIAKPIEKAAISRECEEWFAKPTINPRTKRAIQVGKKVYNDLLKECGSPTQQAEKEGEKQKAKAKPQKARVEAQIETQVEDEKWMTIRKLKADCIPPEFRWIKGERRPGYCQQRVLPVQAVIDIDDDVKIIDYIKRKDVPRKKPEIEVVEISPEKPKVVNVLKPKQFPEYKVIDELGAGVYGKVNKIKTSDGKIYAEKVYFRDIDFNEIDTLFRLNHPNLLRGEAIFYKIAKGAKKFESNLHVILPIAYKNLRDFSFSAEGRAYFTDNENRLDFIFQILSGLNFLHQNGIYHCDLKDDNVLVFKEGDKYNFKISDFGLSYGLETDLGQCGAPLYAAPEYYKTKTKKKALLKLDDNQIKDQRLSDQFSLGVLIFKVFFRDNASLDYIQNKKIIGVILNNLKNIIKDNFLKTTISGVAKMMEFLPTDRFTDLQKAAEAFGIRQKLTGGSVIETFYPVDCNKTIKVNGKDTSFSQLLRETVTNIDFSPENNPYIYTFVFNTIDLVKRLAGTITSEAEFKYKFAIASNLIFEVMGFGRIDSGIILVPVDTEAMLSTVAELQGVIKSPNLMDYAECEQEIIKLFKLWKEDKNCDFVLNTRAEDQHNKLVGECKTRSTDILKNKKTNFGKFTPKN